MAYMTALVILEIVRIAPLLLGRITSLFGTKKCPPALLHVRKVGGITVTVKDHVACLICDEMASGFVAA
jgi:hypothetical protein